MNAHDQIENDRTKIEISIAALTALTKESQTVEEWSDIILRMSDQLSNFRAGELDIPEQPPEVIEAERNQLSKLRELRAFLRGLQNGDSVQIPGEYMKALNEVVS